MRNSRFYHPERLSTDTTVNLSSEVAHRCINVLRLRTGDSLVLFDGSANEYACEITQADKRRVEVAVETEISLDPQSPLTLHLAQAISKGDRMEMVLQKATELGVTEITPIISERCVVKLDPNRWQKKHEQWQKIIIGACEQCGRNTLPTLNESISLNDFLSQSTLQTRLILSPTAEHSFNGVTNARNNGFRLLIGPEGGLTEPEIHLANESGFQSVRFGPRILRTETAALSAISVLQSRFGDLL